MQRALTGLVWILACLTVLLLLIGLYSTCSWRPWAMSDYGVYSNAIWNCGFGHPFKVLLDRSYLTTHLSFTLALLGPCYRIWDHPLLLMVVQWLLYVAGWLLLWRAAVRHRLRRDVTAALLFFAAAYPLNQTAMLSSFHGVVLYLFLLPWLYYTLSFCKRMVWLPLALLLGLREDAFLFAVIPLLVVAYRDRWRAGWVYAGLALLYGVLALTVLFPLITGMTLLERRGGELGDAGVRILFDHEALMVRARSAFWILLPTVFFWRRGGRALLVFVGVPFLITILSGDARQAALRNHYPAVVMASLTVGLLDTIARHRRFNSGTAAVILVAVTIVGHAALGFLWFGGRHDPQFTRPHAQLPIILRAVKQIPREGALLCPFHLGGLCGNREDVISWREYKPERHHIDVVFGSLQAIGGRDRKTFADWLTSGTFGVVAREGDYVVMQRGFDPARNADILALADELSHSIQQARTFMHGGRNDTTADGVVARYWEGRPLKDLLYVAFGKAHQHPAGRFTAVLYYRALSPAKKSTNDWGRFSVHELGHVEALAETPIPPLVTDPDSWQPLVLTFSVGAETKLEPRVAGGVAPLWLNRVVIRQLEKATAVPPEAKQVGDRPGQSF
ncbi:MAG: DUF2079 domain-containing protein [Verrucomicrobia bacterium]|nr:DUF2079 domain-containing protein [Verrucomicrobiota bacterium]